MNKMKPYKRIFELSVTNHGFWFSILGRGVSFLKSAPLFSERHGYRKTIRFGEWRFMYLPKYERQDEQPNKS